MNSHGPRRLDEPGKMRAAIYARVSTEEQVGGTSLGTQLTRCRAHLDYQGWVPAGEFVDEGVSGAKASRPELDRLMARVSGGTLDVVVVAKLDRIGRSMRNLAQLMGTLDDAGVALVSISESFDSLTPAGRLQRNMLGSFAEFERATIRERVGAGIEATALAGHWPSGVAPFGFRINHAGRCAELEINEDEAKVLRRAVDLVVGERMSTGRAAAELNAAGLLPRRAARWHAAMLRELLVRHEGLSGHYVWRRLGLGAAGAPVSLQIPAIITPEAHERLRARLAETARGRTVYANRYLLVGRLTSPCGEPMWGQTAQVGSMYRCAGRCRGGLEPAERCSCRTVWVGLADRVVWSEVAAVLSDPARLLAMAGLELDRAEAGLELDNEDLAAIDRRIARLAKAAGSEVAKLLGAGLDPMVAGHALASLHEDLATARAQRERVVAWQATNAQRADRRQRLWELAASAAATLPDADMATKYRILELLEVQVSVTGWELCAECEGKGSFGVKGVGGLGSRQTGQRATPCPACNAHRYVPSFEIAGVLPEVCSLEDSAAKVAETQRWPFTMVDNA